MSSHPDVPRVAADARLYDERYYATYEGGSYDRGGHWTRFFGYISDEVLARYNPRTTLDAGCALGVFVEELRARGVDAWGVDVSEFAISTVPEPLRPYCFQGSLTEPLPASMPEQYDMVTCIEVLEHMDRADGDRAIARLCSMTDRILFSSTPDGYAEPTHFACRSPEEWSAVFARHGFLRDFDADASFVAPWAVLYTRREATPFEIVHEYDRRHARLVDENRQLRQKVIEQDRALAAASDDAPQDQIRELRARLLAARDALEGAEAERDAVLASHRDLRRQVTERVKAETLRRAEALNREGLAWRVGTAVLAPGRRLRSLVRARR